MTPTRVRRWLELRARCPAAPDRAELLAEGLVALGGRAVEERAGWYVTYLEEPPDAEAFVGDARARLTALTGLEDVELGTEWQAHEDWAETWKRGLEARRITERIVVRPSWTEPLDARPGEVEIVLDPGMAFGTAEHGTTRGCLRLLDRAVREADRVLDVGAGSGILAIAAARLGAREVIAIEGDPLACEALGENVARNGVEARVRVVEAWADVDTLQGHGEVSGVVANLETGVLLPLVPGLRGALAGGGWLIVSGILADEWPGVERALAAVGCTLESVDADGAWRSALLAVPAREG